MLSPVVFSFPHMNLPKIKAPEVICPSLRIYGAFFWVTLHTWSLDLVLS